MFYRESDIKNIKYNIHKTNWGKSKGEDCYDNVIIELTDSIEPWLIKFLADKCKDKINTLKKQLIIDNDSMDSKRTKDHIINLCMDYEKLISPNKEALIHPEDKNLSNISLSEKIDNMFNTKGKYHKTPKNPIKSGTRNRFYVALTRAHKQVFLVSKSLVKSLQIQNTADSTK